MAYEAISKPELCCLNTMLSLDDNKAAPVNIKKNSNVFDRLLMDDFSSPWELTTDPSVPGKNPPILPSTDSSDNLVRRYYTYEKPYCDEEVEVATTNICDVTNATVDPIGYLAVDINQSASKTWKTTIAEFGNLCEAPSQRRADKLRRAAYALKLDANKKIITQLYSMISDYADGTNGLTAPKTLNLLTDDAKVNPVEMAKLDAEYRESLFNDDYIVLGGAKLADYFSVAKYQMSPEGRVGVLNSMIDFPFIYDWNFDPIFQGLAVDTLSHAVAVPIGSMFVDTFNLFRGDEELSDDNYVYTTIMIDGVLYDYSLVFNHCDKYWQEMLTLHFGIGGIPDSIYCDGNGLIRHYLIGCGQADCI